ncbi:MAG: hypothetical protein ACI8P3_002001 [Saprospiraceae bacterium]|jgi:hypothetical protein
MVKVKNGNDVEITLEVLTDPAGDPIHVSYSATWTPETPNGPSQPVTTEGNVININGLPPGETYTISITAICVLGGYTSPAIEVIVIIPDSGCELVSAPVLPQPCTAITNLYIGDIVTIGDFQVTISDVTNVSPGGIFSGSGYTSLPYFNFILVEFVFTDITIQECDGEYYVTNGFMEVPQTGNLEDIIGDFIGDFDPFGGNLLDDLENALEVLKNLANEVQNPEDYFKNVHGLASDIADLLPEIPFMDQSLIDALNAALDCMENLPDPDNGNVAFLACKEQLCDALNNLINHINTLYDGDYQVVFYKTTPQTYGFDGQKYAIHKSEYDHIESVAGEPYSVAWKSVRTGETDWVNAMKKDESAIPDIIFKDGKKDINGNEIEIASSSLGNGHKQFEVTGQPIHGAIQEIFAIQEGVTSHDHDEDDINDPAHKHIAGKLNVVTYDEKSVNIVLIPVNRPIYPQAEFDQIGIKLTSIYLQAGVDVNLSQVDGFTSDVEEPFSDTPPGFLTAYNSQMKSLISDYGSNYGKDDDTYYIFLVDVPHENPNRIGYMPKKRQYGFIFLSNISNDPENEILTKNIAHEVGHGAYVLEHTFEIYPSNPEQTSLYTDNLMDYGEGTHLQKYQWDLIHNPASNFTLFDSYIDGSSLSLFSEFIIEAIPESQTGDFKWQDWPKGKAFLTPNGVAIQSQQIERVVFSEDGYGYVRQFKTIDGTKYKQRIWKSDAGPEYFIGYYLATLNLPNASGSEALLKNEELINKSVEDGGAGGYFELFEYVTVENDAISGNGYAALPNEPHYLNPPCICSHIWTNSTTISIANKINVPGIPIENKINPPYIPYHGTEYYSFCENNCEGNNALNDNIASYIYLNIKKGASEITPAQDAEIIILSNHIAGLITYDNPAADVLKVGFYDQDEAIENMSSTLAYQYLGQEFKINGDFTPPVFTARFPIAIYSSQNNLGRKIKDVDVIFSSVDLWGIPGTQEETEYIPEDYNKEALDWGSFLVAKSSTYEEFEEHIDLFEEMITHIEFSEASITDDPSIENGLTGSFDGIKNYIKEFRVNPTGVMNDIAHNNQNILNIYAYMGAYDKLYYSHADLVKRRNLFENDPSSVFMTAISNWEHCSEAQPISVHDYYNFYLGKYQTTSSFYLGQQYEGMIGVVYLFYGLQTVANQLPSLRRQAIQAMKPTVKAVRDKISKLKSYIKTGAKPGPSGFNLKMSTASASAKSNARIMRNWAKSKGYKRKIGSGLNSDTPEEWGIYDGNGNFTSLVKIDHNGGNGTIKLTIKKANGEFRTVKLNNHDEILADNILLDDFFRFRLDLVTEAQINNASPVLPAAPNMRTISKGKIQDNGIIIEAREGPRIKAEIEEVMKNGDSDGLITESVTQKVFQDAGLKDVNLLANNSKVNDNANSRGLDNVFYKGTMNSPTKLVVVESKPLTAEGKIRLNGANNETGLPSQGSKEWIEKQADLLIATGIPDKMAVGHMIRNNPTMIEIYVTAVNKTTGEFIIVKLELYNSP